MSKFFKYESVKQRLENELFNSMQPGDFLPPLPELCNMFQVSSITLNRALRDLAAEGKLERIKHRGTRLRPAAAELRSDIPGKKMLRILSTHPHSWMIMQVLEKKLVDFCRSHGNLELRLEYTSREEQLERLKDNDYDLIFADSGQLKLMLYSSVLRHKIRPLSAITGLHFNSDEYAPSAIKLASDHRNVLYGMPLTAGPNLQLINRSSGMAPELMNLSNVYDSWFKQLANLQKNRQPLLIMPLDYRYMEPIFRSYGVQLFDDDTRQCNLDTPRSREVIKMLEYYLHQQQLGMLVTEQKGLLDTVQDGVLKYSPVALRISSTIFLKPACSCVSFAVKTPPQAKCMANWLFWEGVLVGKCCDCSIAADLLNYLQSASVQSMLPGCTSLPARLDMQNLALAAYEPEFPGITAAYKLGMQHADNPAALPYDVLREFNLYLRTVICGMETVGGSIKAAAKRINNLLLNSQYQK